VLVACCSDSFTHSSSEGKFSFPFLINDVRIWTPAANKIAVIILLNQNFKISNVVIDFAILNKLVSRLDCRSCHFFGLNWIKWWLIPYSRHTTQGFLRKFEKKKATFNFFLLAKWPFLQFNALCYNIKRSSETHS